MNSNFSDKVEELEDNIDTINMKLNELKNIQRNHDNVIKIYAYGYAGPVNPISKNSKYMGKYFLNVTTGDLFIM